MHHPPQAHPSVTSLNLSHNPIGDRGGTELAALLAANPSILQLQLQGAHLTRKYSRDHHDRLGPSACEDGRPIMQVGKGAQAWADQGGKPTWG